MKPTLTIIPSISIHPDRVCRFNQVSWEPCRPSRNHFSHLKLFNDDSLVAPISKYSARALSIINSDRKAKGLVSIQAKRKMIKALDYMLLITSNKSAFARMSGKEFNFKIAFITLTLPSEQIHVDKTIKNQCLNQFLIEIQRFYKVRNYLWRAERQENGNLHFHVLIDRFIDWSEMRDRWNRIINKLGYVDRYQAKMKEYYRGGFRKSNNKNDKRPVKQQYKAYLANHRSDFRSPNSTDIHSIKRITNIKQYVSKYMTKTHDVNNSVNVEASQNPFESGRIWGCNHELSNIQGARCEIDNVLSRELEILESVPEIKRVHDTYFSVYYVNFQDLSGIRSRGLFNLFCKYLIQKFNYNVQLLT